ncbi:recombinase family protein [Streptomyces sp. NPDC054919]
MRQPTCIIYVRLSRDTDASTSVASQTAACQAYAEAQGWHVLFVADADVDVSGASRLEDRPGMARVLAALGSADYVLAAKLDRYARSVLEFSRLLRAAEESGATLITADGTLNPTTSKLIVHVLSAFAEYERDMIKARILTSKNQLRAEGRWLGGAAPFGYRLIKRNGGTYLDIDPESAAIVRDCADKLINHGASMTSLMHDLNGRGILSPADYARKRDGRKVRGTRWSTTTLRDVMTSPVARGWLCQAPADKPRTAANLVPVLDAVGEPQQVGPELLDADTWTAAREAVERRSVGRGVSRAGKALLLHVAECSECSGPMYHQQREASGKDYSIYICKNGVGKTGSHASNIIQARGLEAQTKDAFLRLLGRANLMREVTSGGRDVAREVRETEAALDNLSGNLAALPAGGRAAGTVINQISALEAKLDALRAEGDTPTQTEWVATGRTIAEEWEARDTAGRNAMLREYGARVTVSPRPQGAEYRFTESRSAVTFAGPAWVRENDPATAELISIAMDEMDLDPATAEQIVRGMQAA